MRPRIRTRQRQLPHKNITTETVDPVRQPWIKEYREVQLWRSRGFALAASIAFFGFALVCSFALLLLQGFAYQGFFLDAATMKLVQASTLGEVATLIGLGWKFIFAQ